MLSILISELNWSCYDLVHSLWSQASRLQVNFEIIVADDHSDNSETIIENRNINNIAHCSFIELKETLGRASIRNWLADKSIYPFLLFLDCDAMVQSESFIKDYLDSVSLANVVCGGVRHPDELPSKGVELRYKYEKKADKRRDAKYRNKNKYSRFTTFSFMIERNVFMSVRFDEKIKNYGYEDVIFGATLEKKGVSIVHINNPLIHLGIESNTIYLRKIEESIVSLVQSYHKLEGKSTLFSIYLFIKKAGLTPVILLLWKFLKKPIRSNLESSKPMLALFALYKIGYVCQVDKYASATDNLPS